MPDSAIDDSDSLPIRDNKFGNRSRLLSLFKAYEQQITLCLDADLIAWARRDGDGYPTRINAHREAMVDESRTKKPAR